MTNKTNKEILEELSPYKGGKWGMVDLDGEEYIPKSFVLQALSRKEEEMIELFKEALPSKLRGADDHCNGHNNCLSQIKNNLKSKGIEL